MFRAAEFLLLLQGGAVSSASDSSDELRSLEAAAKEEEEEERSVAGVIDENTWYRNEAILAALVSDNGVLDAVGDAEIEHVEVDDEASDAAAEVGDGESNDACRYGSPSCCRTDRSAGSLADRSYSVGAPPGDGGEGCAERLRPTVQKK